MKIWIAECVNHPDDYVFVSRNREQLKKDVLSAPLAKGKIYRWDRWQIEVELNMSFLKQICHPSFNYKKLPQVPGSFGFFFTANGEIYRSPYFTFIKNK